jgi:DNA polymerase III delta' subunit
MTLKPIIGHTSVQQILTDMVATSSLPHALLFHGSQGIGKRLVAEKLAYHLFCPDTNSMLADNLSVDSNHELYPQLEEMSHPDYKILEPEEGKKVIKISQVRELINQLHLSADGKKIVIIDSAEQMNVNSSNALLKTLEEPGDNIHIILICHNLSKLLPTIISRCRQFRFNPLNKNEITQVIQQDSTKVDIDKYINFTSGSPGELIHIAKEGKIAMEQLNIFFQNPQNINGSEINQMAELLQRKKQAGIALSILMTYISNQFKQDKNHKWGDVYEKIQHKQQNMAEFNLNAQLTLEAALTDVSAMYR